MRRLLAVCAVLGVPVLSLSACYSTGHFFYTDHLHELVVGQSTEQDVIQLVEAEPTARYYRPSDGSYLAIWSYSRTLYADSALFNKELWLEFDTNHILLNVIKK